MNFFSRRASDGEAGGGLATAATLREMTDVPAIAAFTAGNLLPVAQSYRAV